MHIQQNASYQQCPIYIAIGFWAVETVNTWDLRLYAVSGTSVDLISGDFCKPRKADIVGARLYATCPCPITWYKNFWNKKGMWKRLLNWKQL